MKKSNIITLLLILFSSTIYAQNLGFIRKKNELGINVMDVLSWRYTIDYKRTLTKNIGVFGSLTMLNGKFELSNFEDSDENSSDIVSEGEVYGSQHGYGLEYGGGLLFSSPATGMALPIGHYIGIGYYIKNIDFTEELNNDPNIYDYNDYGQSIRVLLGRDFYLSKSFSLDTYLSTGYSFGSITEANNLEKQPEELVANSNGLADTSFERNENMWDYSELYFRIGVKICIMF